MTTENKKLQLYRGFRDVGTYVWSPYVTKLEFRLRHGNIPYEYHPGSTRSGPKGKIPYVDISALTGSDTPELVGDSALITKHLIELGRLHDLNGQLDAEKHLSDLSVRAILEDKLGFYNTCERWLSSDRNYYAQRDKVLEGKPWLVRVILGNIIHRSLTQTVYAQGAGRHSPDEQKMIRSEIWESLGAQLEERRKQADKPKGGKDEPFWVLGGEEATEADFTLFGFTCSVLMCQACPDSQALVKSIPALTDYANRIHSRYFPDYEKWED